MRKRFEEQHELGLKPISETKVLLKSRDDFPAIVAALKEIFITKEYNEKIFSILESVILKDKKKTGRRGLDLWQIFVLAQVRLGLNIDYDRLEMMVNSNSILRQLIGIEYELNIHHIEISRQRIIDNVSLLDDQSLRQINDEIVKFGHDVFKKKEKELLRLKTDSYVIEANVHFPTDYNLLWDSARKSLDVIHKLRVEQPTLAGWRKITDWVRNLKNLSRSLGKATGSAGSKKAEKVKDAADDYLKKARILLIKLKETKNNFNFSTLKEFDLIVSLEYFISMLDKHIDLVDRRLIKGEKIPHEDKLFSIFETYTEWISKGKINKRVELGKRLSITTDQFNLIIDYHLHENTTDSQVVLAIADRIFENYKIRTWSFDKGYWHIDNKELLKEHIEKIIMPKKGKPNKIEKAEEHEAEFKKYRHAHSAIESNINELEHRGLDRCPDKGHDAFKRYIGVGVIAYNLHKIGKQIMKNQRLEERKIAA